MTAVEAVNLIVESVQLACIVYLAGLLRRR